MYAINLGCYTYLTICTGLMILGVVLPPVTLLGCFGHACGCCVQLAAIIVTAVYRYSEEGKKCAESEWIVTNKLPEQEPDETFSSHADLVQKLFIAACVTFLF